MTLPSADIDGKNNAPLVCFVTCTGLALPEVEIFQRLLVDFMTSGPVVVQVLEGPNAVARYREVMGATNPAEAAEGTIRKLFAESVGENSVHGSDSPENAAIEIAQFFDEADIVA